YDCFVPENSGQKQSDSKSHWRQYLNAKFAPAHTSARCDRRQRALFRIHGLRLRGPLFVHVITVNFLDPNLRHLGACGFHTPYINARQGYFFIFIPHFSRSVEQRERRVRKSWPGTLPLWSKKKAAPTAGAAFRLEPGVTLSCSLEDEQS